MANRFKGEVSFRAGDIEYTMRFSANALCELEDAIGMGVNAVATQLADPSSLRLKMVRSVFWAGLRDRHPDMTIKHAGDLITELSLTKAMELVSDAFTLAFAREAEAHPPQPGEAGPAKTDQAGTGSAS